MFAYPLRTAALAVAAIVGLSACTTPYGYSGIGVGLGNAGYYDPYYGGYGYGAGYPRYGYGYGAGYPGYGFGYGFNPYWGWNDGFYYPGTGFYVYDVYRNPYRWTDSQRRYWTLRRERALATSTTSQPVVIRDNWDDFKRDKSTVRGNRVERQVSRPVRTERQLSRPERIERQQNRVFRAERVKSPDRVERDTIRTQRTSARLERQTAREQRKSEVRAERSSRGNGRNKGATSEE